MKEIGRNDPCPCGSGKKYKKCCMEKDEKAKKDNVIPFNKDREWSRDPFPLYEGPDDFDYDEDDEMDYLDVDDEAFQKYFFALKNAPLDKKAEVAIDFIKNEDWFVDEDVLDVLDYTMPLLEKGDNLAEVEKIVNTIKEFRPDAYKEAKAEFQLMVAEANVSIPGADMETPLSAALGGIHEVYESFMDMVDKIMFLGRANELCSAIDNAWEQIEANPYIHPDQNDELAKMHFSLLLNRELTKNPDLKPQDLDSMHHLDNFKEEEQEWTEKVMSHLSGRSFFKWKPHDFRVKDKAELIKNIHLITIDMAAVLRKKHGWNSSRALLAHYQLVNYTGVEFLEKRRKKKSLTDQDVKKLLLPAMEPVEEFLAELLSREYPPLYEAAAFCLALPLWIDFLADSGFCNAKKASELHDEIKQAVLPPVAILLHEQDKDLTAALQSSYSVTEEDIEKLEKRLMEEEEEAEDFYSPDFDSELFMDTDAMLKEFSQKLMTEQRESVESKTLTPNTKLAPALKKQPAIWVEAISEQAGIGPFSKKKERINALEESLPLPETLYSLWRKLPLESRRMVRHILAEGGFAKLADLETEFGKDNDMSWFWNEGYPPVTALGLLRYSGLVFVGTASRNNREFKIAAVPVELREGLKNIIDSPDAFDDAPPLPEQQEDAFVKSCGLFGSDDSGPEDLEGRSLEEKLDHIRDFVDKCCIWEDYTRDYEYYLDVLLKEESAGSRELARRILEVKTISRYAKNRLEAYKQGLNLFGEEFIKPALSDSAKSVAEWARKILDPQGRLF